MSHPRKNWIGLRAGTLAVIAWEYWDKSTFVRVLCDCGNEKVVSCGNFYKAKSCGCIVRTKQARRVALARRMIAHGAHRGEIAAALGMNIRGLRQFLNRHGIKKRPRRRPGGCRRGFGKFKGQDTRDAAVAFAATHSAKETAMKFGVADRTVLRWCARARAQEAA